MKVSTLPLIVLCLFMGYTFWVMAGADQSLLAFGAQLMPSPDTAQVVIDLYILAALACIWMYQDAKRRGKGMGLSASVFRGDRRICVRRTAALSSASRWWQAGSCAR